MAVSTFVYTKFRQNLMQGVTMNLQTAGNVKAMLVTSAYTPAIDTNNVYTDVSTNEVANGNGYTTGGVTCTNVLVQIDTTNHRAWVDLDDLSWSSASFTAKYVVFYYNVGSKQLICYIDLDDTSGSNSKTVQGGTFSVTIDTNGLFAM